MNRYLDKVAVFWADVGNPDGRDYLINVDRGRVLPDGNARDSISKRLGVVYDKLPRRGFNDDQNRYTLARRGTHYNVLFSNNTRDGWGRISPIMATYKGRLSEDDLIRKFHIAESLRKSVDTTSSFAKTTPHDVGLLHAAMRKADHEYYRHVGKRLALPVAGLAAITAYGIHKYNKINNDTESEAQ